MRSSTQAYGLDARGLSEKSAARSVRAAPGAENKRTIKVISSLIDLYDAWNKPDQAVQWLSKRPPKTDPENQSNLQPRYRNCLTHANPELREGGSA